MTMSSDSHAGELGNVAGRRVAQSLPSDDTLVARLLDGDQRRDRTLPVTRLGSNECV
jgi:hypothetical protein